MTIEKYRTTAGTMQPRDIVGSGEMVVSVSAGVRTPRDKVEVILEKNGQRRMAIWGKHTTICISREVKESR